jgi:lipopolysaccharide transport system ATP-binding protein
VSTVIKVENLSKRYRLGAINRDMLYKDLQSRWAKFRGKEDPDALIGGNDNKCLSNSLVITA